MLGSLAITEKRDPDSEEKGSRRLKRGNAYPGTIKPVKIGKRKLNFCDCGENSLLTTLEDGWKGNARRYNPICSHRPKDFYLTSGSAFPFHYVTKEPGLGKPRREKGGTAVASRG